MDAIWDDIQSTVSNINVILNKEDVTLAEVLSDDGILPQLGSDSPDSPLMTFLSRQDIVSELIDTMYWDKSLAEDEDPMFIREKVEQRMKAAEVLSFGVTRIISTLANDTHLLSQLFSIIPGIPISSDGLALFPSPSPASSPTIDDFEEDSLPRIHPRDAHFFSRVFRDLIKKQIVPVMEFLGSEDDMDVSRLTQLCWCVDSREISDLISEFLLDEGRNLQYQRVIETRCIVSRLPQVLFELFCFGTVLPVDFDLEAAANKDIPLPPPVLSHEGRGNVVLILSSILLHSMSLLSIEVLRAASDYVPFIISLISRAHFEESVENNVLCRQAQYLICAIVRMFGSAAATRQYLPEDSVQNDIFVAGEETYRKLRDGFSHFRTILEAFYVEKREVYGSMPIAMIASCMDQAEELPRSHVSQAVLSTLQLISFLLSLNPIFNSQRNRTVQNRIAQSYHGSALTSVVRKYRENMVVELIANNPNVSSHTPTWDGECSVVDIAARMRELELDVLISKIFLLCPSSTIFHVATRLVLQRLLSIGLPQSSQAILNDSGCFNRMLDIVKETLSLPPPQRSSLGAFCMKFMTDLEDIVVLCRQQHVIREYIDEHPGTISAFLSNPGGLHGSDLYDSDDSDDSSNDESVESDPDYIAGVAGRIDFASIRANNEFDKTDLSGNAAASIVVNSDRFNEFSDYLEEMNKQIRSFDDSRIMGTNIERLRMNTMTNFDFHVDNFDSAFDPNNSFNAANNISESTQEDVRESNDVPESAFLSTEEGPVSSEPTQEEFLDCFMQTGGDNSEMEGIILSRPVDGQGGDVFTPAAGDNKETQLGETTPEISPAVVTIEETDDESPPDRQAPTKAELRDFFDMSPNSGHIGNDNSVQSITTNTPENDFFSLSSSSSSSVELNPTKNTIEEGGSFFTV